jgi:Zn-dependent protease with chaperone function
MKRIIAVSGINDVEWEIHVIDDPRAPPNAFVLPGGKVFVFRSILPICGNDDGLATVLAHETAHQVNRHTAENLSKAPFYMLLSLFMYTITGSDSLNRLLMNGLLQLPASRAMEREADYVGLIMMARACFNPSEAVHVWERMTQYEQRAAGRLGGGSIPEFFSTHPSSPHRIELIRSWEPEASMEREKAGCNGHGALMSGFRDMW